MSSFLEPTSAATDGPVHFGHSSTSPPGRNHPCDRCAVRGRAIWMKAEFHSSHISALAVLTRMYLSYGLACGPTFVRATSVLSIVEH